MNVKHHALESRFFQVILDDVGRNLLDRPYGLSSVVSALAIDEKESVILRRHDKGDQNAKLPNR